MFVIFAFVMCGDFFMLYISCRSFIFSWKNNSYQLVHERNFSPPHEKQYADTLWNICHGLSDSLVVLSDSHRAELTCWVSLNERPHTFPELIISISTLEYHSDIHQLKYLSYYNWILIQNPTIKPQYLAKG